MLQKKVVIPFVFPFLVFFTVFLEYCGAGEYYIDFNLKDIHTKTSELAKGITTCIKPLRKNLLPGQKIRAVIYFTPEPHPDEELYEMKTYIVNLLSELLTNGSFVIMKSAKLSDLPDSRVDMVIMVRADTVLNKWVISTQLIARKDSYLLGSAQVALPLKKQKNKRRWSPISQIWSKISSGANIVWDGITELSGWMSNIDFGRYGLAMGLQYQFPVSPKFASMLGKNIPVAPAKFFKVGEHFQTGIGISLCPGRQVNLKYDEDGIPKQVTEINLQSFEFFTLYHFFDAEYLSWNDVIINPAFGVGAQFNKISTRDTKNDVIVFNDRAIFFIIGTKLYFTTDYDKNFCLDLNFSRTFVAKYTDFWVSVISLSWFFGE